MANFERGYIKLFRKIDSWEWYTEPNTIRMFLHCLIKANHTDKMWRGIIIHAGSFVTSRAKLAEELNITERQVRTSINRLKTTNELTCKSTNHYTVITVNNWHLYQINDQQNDRQEVQQTTTTNNYKNNNIVPIKNFIKPTIEEIQNYCIERNNNVDAENFYNHYESNGWKVGKSSMKDWRAAVRTWENRQNKYISEQNNINQEGFDYASAPYRPF